MQDHLRILVSKDGDMFVAQCLEHDIAVQAEDIATLEKRLIATIEAECGMGTVCNIPAAPEEFHAMWDSARELQSTVDNAEVRLAA